LNPGVDPMSLITLIFVLVVVGIILWLVNSYIPMDPKIKQILNVVVVIAVILWLLNAFGVFSRLDHVQVGHSADTATVYVAKAFDAADRSVISGSVMAAGTLNIPAPYGRRVWQHIRG
jgi:hypothetical protein